MTTIKINLAPSASFVPLGMGAFSNTTVFSPSTSIRYLIAGISESETPTFKIFAGESSVTKMYVGGSQVSKVYLGSTLIQEF